MCNNAKLNKMTSNFFSNCNVQPNQWCCGKSDTAKEQYMYAKKTTNTFVANERYMTSHFLHAQYTYVVILRDSMKRYASHYNHANPPTSFSEWLEGQPDNWITRHLCGMTCKNITKFALKPNHLLLAKKHLDQFDHVLILNSTFSAQVLNLNNHLKWEHVNLKAFNRRKYSAEQLIKLVPTKKRFLMTALDNVILTNDKRSWSKLTHYWKQNPVGPFSCGAFCSKY